MKYIDTKVIQAAMDYKAYRQLIDDLFAQDKTTGSIQNEAMLRYTELNMARMRRLDKTTRLTDTTVADVEAIDRPMIWLTLTEAWCADAAQIIPVIEHIAAKNEQIQPLYILRDEHLEVMDAFLTNGKSRSIPKTIFLDADTLKVLGSWGPRPSGAQKMIDESIEQAAGISDQTERKAYLDEVKKQVQLQYARDKTRSIQAELMDAVGKVGS